MLINQGQSDTKTVNKLEDKRRCGVSSLRPQNVGWRRAGNFSGGFAARPTQMREYSTIKRKKDSNNKELFFTSCDLVRHFAGLAHKKIHVTARFNTVINAEQ